MDNLSGHMWGTLIMRVKFLDSLLCRDELKKARNIVLVTKDGTMGLKVSLRNVLEPAMFCHLASHLALWRGKGKVKDPRYMQNKKNSRMFL